MDSLLVFEAKMELLKFEKILIYDNNFCQSY